jgi:hypothetical protein
VYAICAALQKRTALTSTPSVVIGIELLLPNDRRPIGIDNF